MKFKKLASSIIFVITANLWGHGMDKPGPHGGYIKMPGAFHTELVLEGDNLMKVFLLDKNFQFPVTKKSSLTGTLKGKQTEENMDCTASGDHFSCKLNRPLQSGDKIVLKANRQGITGGFAIYTYPLKYVNF